MAEYSDAEEWGEDDYLDKLFEVSRQQASTGSKQHAPESSQDCDNNQPHVHFLQGIPRIRTPESSPRFISTVHLPEMSTQRSSRHEGKPVSFEISQEGIIVLEDCKNHRLGDTVISIISEYDPRALQDFLDFKNIKSFTFLYPGGYLFLPTSHLIILREENLVLIGGYQDSTRYFHWQPQILFNIDKTGRWTILSAIRERDEVISGSMMSSAKDLNVSRNQSQDPEYYEIADAIADVLSEALLTFAMKSIVPIVEAKQAVGNTMMSNK